MQLHIDINAYLYNADYGGQDKFLEMLLGSSIYALKFWEQAVKLLS